MNVWAKRTVELATKSDYLDQLYVVYPSEPAAREIEGTTIARIKELYERKEQRALLNELLDLERFPIKDSYISFLRKDRGAIDRNPRTVKRLCTLLFGMGFEKLREGIESPKEANTRRGPQFRHWARRSFKHLSLDAFQKSSKGIVFLDDNESTILDFCNTQLRVGLSKRPDFIAKSGKEYVVGEAKFLSSLGGNQGRGFDDAINLATRSAGRAHKVAVIDGVVWIERGSQEFQRVSRSTANIFSALLLQKFLLNLA